MSENGDNVVPFEASPDRQAPGQRRPDAPQLPPGSPFEEFFRDFFDPSLGRRVIDFQTCYMRNIGDRIHATCAAAKDTPHAMMAGSTSSARLRPAITTTT